MSIAGVQRATDRADENARILTETLVVQNSRNLRTPSICHFTTLGFVPGDWDRVVVCLGGEDNPERLFIGTVFNVTDVYIGPLMTHSFVECVDNTRQINRQKVYGRFIGPVRDVLLYLVATYCPEIGVSFIASNCGTLDESMSFSGEDVTDCIEKLRKRVGAATCYLAPEGTYGNLHFSLVAESIGAAFTPDTIQSGHPSLKGDNTFKVGRNGIGRITRVNFEGGGASCLTEIVAGGTIIPVEDSAWYNALGGVVIVKHNKFTYTARVVGGGGSLVGPGVGPGSAPVIALAAGAGIESGDHSWAYAYVVGAGRSLPSPLASMNVGFVSAPTSTPVAGTVQAGAGPDDGVHLFAISHVTAAGETPPGPTVSKTTSSRSVSAPVAAWSISAAGAGSATLLWNIGDSVYVKATYLIAGGETIPGPQTSTLVAIADPLNPSRAETVNVTAVASGDSAVTGIRFYININGAYLGYQDFSNASASCNLFSFVAGSPPGASTAVIKTQQVPLSNLELSPPLGTARKVWGTVAGGSTLKYIATINTTDLTYLVTTADAGLGATAPSVNTAAANRASITVPAGPTGTTDIEIFRTPIGSAQLKKSFAVGSNTAGTYTDSTADAALTTNAPTSDTSGLTQQDGQIIAGSVTIIVADASAFESGGGFAVIGNGRQVVRYTGKTSNSLTGVTGITATITYNSTITQAPQLIGIPASGDGSITDTILKGEQVNIRITVDDTAVQTELETSVGLAGAGVFEETLSDGRMAEDECRARATAYLTLKRNRATRIEWTSQDKNTREGRVIPVNLPERSAIGNYRIQTVTIQNFQPAQFPDFIAVAADELETFEELLRSTRAA